MNLSKTLRRGLSIAVLMMACLLLGLRVRRGVYTHSHANPYAHSCANSYTHSHATYVE